MPLHFLSYVVENGLPSWVPDLRILAAIAVTAASIYLIKVYSSGATNRAEKDMHGKVYIITGGTSGIGSAVAKDLAQRGAQLVLLSHMGPSDPFLADYIGELRRSTENEMIYAEQVDLASLYDVRKFATKWIDNAPPRRLDGVILCGAISALPGQPRIDTGEGIEQTWMVNFLANFHLLGILSPALRNQPFDRDVRVIIATCSSYIASPPLSEELDKRLWTPSRAYARSKLALMVFAQAYQKHLDAHKRPDGLPMNSRVVLVDPGLVRTPGMRRWLTRGTILGLLLYVATYFFHWLLLKSEDRGAQSILYAAMDPDLGRGVGGRLIKECMDVDYARLEVKDETIAKNLWEASDQLIERTEKEQAALRVLQKKMQEDRAKEELDKAKTEEVGALVDAIKKGKETEKAKGKKKGKKSS